MARPTNTQFAVAVHVLTYLAGAGRDREPLPPLRYVWGSERTAPERRAAVGTALAWVLATSPDPTARDGEEGLSYLLTQHFDVLLTDLRMPVMDGFELLNHAMNLPDSKRPGRIIAISGEYEAGVLTGQPVSFLAKPFNLDTLLDTCDNILGRSFCALGDGATPVLVTAAPSASDGVVPAGTGSCQIRSSAGTSGRR